ncbi:hypothetical protein DYB32_002317 [Aphanomyces invadans]|uniref:PD-(D/E)XK endonuclease-like domain-containing protein n=1 Tax=Aphanomyces invadans TaxID=157072 RepID=A0A3R6Z7X7_9STRA|nr:hypothetical protein DYB32_002317 [Aphanomyces invadans]
MAFSTRSNPLKFKSNYEKQIMLFASEVSVICGANPYREISDVFLGVWKRTDKTYVKGLEDELAPMMPETVEEKMDRVIQDEPQVQAILDAPSLSVADVQEKKKAVQAHVNALPHLTPEDKVDVVQALHSTLQTTFGAAQEIHAIEHYETETQSSVQQRNVKFWSKQVGRVQSADKRYRNVLVGGRIDGVSGEKVIEVKNRMRDFKTPLPHYDIVQLQTYLYLLDSTHGELVEHIKAKTKDKSKTTTVDWDPELWNTSVLPYLARFSHSLDRFMDGPQDLHHKFLTYDTKKRKDVIRDLWMDSPADFDG